jgi:hypothetical protein
LLFPAAIVTAFLSLYHMTLLTPENCTIHHEKADFTRGAPPFLKNATRATSQHVLLYTGPYKIYKKWTEPFPCVPAEPQWKNVNIQRSPSHQGLLYTREMKTGSSTLAGVILSIAHRKAKTLLPHSDNLPCKVRVDHSPARILGYGERDKQRSFLISLLRDPTKRAMSQFFHFRVSEEGSQPTDERFQSYFRDNARRLSNYYVRDLAMDHIYGLEEMQNYDSLVQDIIDEYDFIAITERMDESLVVLKMLLDLNYGDVLYMSAKSAGSFTAAGGGPKQKTRCIYIVPSFTTPGMKEFFASKEWKKYIAADLALYKAANASLDKTIDSLGRQEFQQQLATFQRVKEQAQAKCMTRTIYRCDATGRYVGPKNSTCLLWDVGTYSIKCWILRGRVKAGRSLHFWISTGCGHDCLCEFAEEMKL